MLAKEVLKRLPALRPVYRYLGNLPVGTSIARRQFHTAQLLFSEKVHTKQNPVGEKSDVRSILSVL